MFSSLMSTGNLSASGAGHYFYIVHLIQLLFLFCIRVCQLAYTHILHYEHLSSEWTLFLDDIGIHQNIKLPWKNKGTGNDLNKYFKNISLEEKFKVFNKFVNDFEIFGYSIDDEF